MNRHRYKITWLALSIPTVALGEFIGPALALLAISTFLLIAACWR